MSLLQGAPRQGSILKQLAQGQHNVPSYQRPYVWKPERAVDLLSDLWEHSEPPANGAPASRFFLGSLVTVNQNTAGAHAVIDVVDGQQRITTISIIAAAILNIINNDTYVNSAFDEPFGNDGTTLREFLTACLRTKHKVASLVKPMLNVRSGDANAARSWKTIATTAGKNFAAQPGSHAAPSQYTRNYDAIYDQLMKLAGPQSIDRLFTFSSYLVNSVEVVIMEAVNESAALQIFGVVNTPKKKGEALDLPSMLKWQLSCGLRGDNDDDEDRRQEAEDMEKDWADFEASLGTSKDDAALAMCRAWVRRYDLDALIPKIVNDVFSANHGMASYPTAQDTLGRAQELADYFRRCFGIFKALHIVPCDGTALTEVDQAAGDLMALQDMATSSDTKAKAALWQAVAVAVFTAMDVEGFSGAASLKLFDAEGEKAKVLLDILTSLQVILLRAYLCPASNKSTKSYILERMRAALDSAWKLTPSTTLDELRSNPELSGLLMQEQDNATLVGALSGALYNLGGMKDVAMRHGVLKACFLEQVDNMRRTQTRQTTRVAFRTDWTVEHIFPQSGAGGSDADKAFFLTPQSSAMERGSPVHFLGNLTPLEASLNSAAGNKSFKDKKRQVYKDSMLPGVHQLCSHDAFGKEQFEARHEHLMVLVCTALRLDRNPSTSSAAAALPVPDAVDAAGDGLEADLAENIHNAVAVDELDGRSKAELRTFCRVMKLSTAGSKEVIAARIVKHNKHNVRQPTMLDFVEQRAGASYASPPPKDRSASAAASASSSQSFSSTAVPLAREGCEAKARDFSGGSGAGAVSAPARELAEAGPAFGTGDESGASAGTASAPGGVGFDTGVAPAGATPFSGVRKRKHPTADAGSSVGAAAVPFNVEHGSLTRSIYEEALAYREYRMSAKSSAGKRKDTLLDEWDKRAQEGDDEACGRPTASVWKSHLDSAIKGWVMIHDSPVKGDELREGVTSPPFKWAKWWNKKTPPTREEYTAVLEADEYCAKATCSMDEIGKIDESLRKFEESNRTVPEGTWNAMRKRCQAYFDFMEKVDKGQIKGLHREDNLLGQPAKRLHSVGDGVSSS